MRLYAASGKPHSWSRLHKNTMMPYRVVSHGRATNYPGFVARQINEVYCCMSSQNSPNKNDQPLERLLVISFSDLASDPRVNRQIRLLTGRFRLTAAGFADPEIPGVEFVSVQPTPRSVGDKWLAGAMLKMRLFEQFYWSLRTVRDALGELQGRTFDLILANDLLTLPLACVLNSRHGVVFDAHEYSPRELEENWKWRFFYRDFMLYLCEEYIPRTAAMLTVCDGIAEEYARCYGAKPVVVYNAPYLSALEPGPVSSDGIRLVHHGGANASRNIEVMIDMMNSLNERFSLDLFLVPSDPHYLERLRKLAAKQARIRIMPPVPMRQLPQVVNGYDVGVYLLQPNNFNNAHALPNKFFEFVQGRVAIAIGPSPEMAKLVRKYDCGIVADDFTPEALAGELRKLTPERIAQYKMNVHRAAFDLCYENTSRALLSTVSNLLGDG